jgi:hypothetical protein
MQELIEIQAELKAPKGQFNTFGKYNYRNAEDILEALKPLLKEAGCLLVVSDELVNIGERYYIKATATISKGDVKVVVNGYAREEESKKGMDGSQVTGASSSYARKYALNGLFLIDDTKDSDTTNTHDKEPKKEVAKPVLELGTENFNNCKKAYVADNSVLPKIMAKYEMSDEVHSALILE